MTAARAVPAAALPVSANERFKSRFRSLFWASIITATLGHFVAFAYWPELTTRDVSFESDELASIELPPDIEIPPPPAQIVRPATPIMATDDQAEDVTIAPTTFDLNSVEDLPLPPPPKEGATVDVGAQPTFTPFTVAPTILNREVVARAMVDNYPTLLRTAGIGGTVRVFFFIDEEGLVEDYRIQESSGHQLLDQAALAVAGLYRFSPALNRDKRVPVWVLFPIEFRVR
jgi:protein TonB